MIDTSKCIIYPQSSGSELFNIIIPCECGLTIEEIAQKDVPAGTIYKIINKSELPNDRSDRSTWTFDFTNYDGVGNCKDTILEANE